MDGWAALRLQDLDAHQHLLSWQAPWCLHLHSLVSVIVCVCFSLEVRVIKLDGKKVIRVTIRVRPARESDRYKGRGGEGATFDYC